jgi:hypothetical protein
MDDLVAAFLRCGTQAVLDLRDLHTDEAQIGECDLSQCIARKLRADQASWDIRADPFYYTTALTVLGVDVTSRAIVDKFGQISADVGVLRDGCDPVLLEIKRVNDHWRFDRKKGVLDDRDKLRGLARMGRIDGYVGIHVCQVGATDVRKTIKEMEARLGSPLSIGDIYQSKDGKEWEWAFVCAKVTDKGLSAVPVESNPTISVDPLIVCA